MCRRRSAPGIPEDLPLNDTRGYYRPSSLAWGRAPLGRRIIQWRLVIVNDVLHVRSNTYHGPGPTNITREGLCQLTTEENREPKVTRQRQEQMRRNDLLTHF